MSDQVPFHFNQWFITERKCEVASLKVQFMRRCQTTKHRSSYQTLYTPSQLWLEYFQQHFQCSWSPCRMWVKKQQEWGFSQLVPFVGPMIPASAGTCACVHMCLAEGCTAGVRVCPRCEVITAVYRADSDGSVRQCLVPHQTAGTPALSVG